MVQKDTKVCTFLHARRGQEIKKAAQIALCGYFSVGVAGFEPAASTSQMWRDTGLRYTPSGLQK